jgi:BrnA antitoxin of type II toxin-antitoxin system
MPTAKKPMATSVRFSKAEIAAAKAAAPARSSGKSNVEWSKGVVTPGGGVAATVTAIRRTRGPNKRPAKEQVAIRLDQDVVGALRASGPGWQTRVNAALKEWLASQPAKRKPREKSAA